MKRLVYSPYVQAFVKTDTDVIDISPYLVSGTINRKVNQVSGASLVLRNPIKGGSGDMLFTEPKPLFHPMDPIIITMTRLQGHQTQVFTGYLDKSPYIQFYPGLCQIDASCTLKRLLYTQWDAALPFVRYFLEQFGWVLNGDSGIANPTAEEQRIKTFAGQIQGQFNDGSIGALLFAVLNQIGDWDSSTIWIEALPPQIKDLVINIYNSIQTEVKPGEQLFEGLITQVLGSSSQGTGSPSGTVGNATGSGPIWDVIASQESLGGTGCNSIPIPADGQGYSELSTVPQCTSNVSTCDFAALGKIPCQTPMVITNMATGKSVTVPKVDNGAGSTFNGPSSGYPVMGLYPGTITSLGLPLGGNPFHVRIQRADGKPLSPVRGNLVSNSSTSLTGKGSNLANAGVPNFNSLAPSNNSSAATTTPNAQLNGTSPGGKTGNNAGTVAGYFNPFAQSHGLSAGRIDMGVDYGGTGPVVALGNGTIDVSTSGSGWPGGGFISYKLSDGQFSGYTVYIAENVSPISSLHSGSPVVGGQTVIGNMSGGGIETGWGTGGGVDLAYSHADWSGKDSNSNSTAAGVNFAQLLKSLGVPTVSPAPNILGTFGGPTPSGTGNVGTAGAGTGTGTGSGSAMAAAFSTFINLPSIFDTAEALAFTGTRSFIADQPLFPFIEQLCQASLRNFMSMPNGNFFAFFPDYFGLFGRKYYWEIHDIEIIDGRIDLSDDPLVTHVAVAGDVTQYHGQVDVFDLIQTSGIFTIFDAFATGYIGNLADSNVTINSVSKATTPAKKKPAKNSGKFDSSTTTPPSQSKSAALAFLQRYGARPYVEEAPMIRSPFFELFLAFQKFMLLWSKQFQTTFELTFMPELFPGGLIAFPEHHLQCYIEEVSHGFDYESGFTTTVNLSSPSKFDSQTPDGISQGMARDGLPRTVIAPTVPRHHTSKR